MPKGIGKKTKKSKLLKRAEKKEADPRRYPILIAGLCVCLISAALPFFWLPLTVGYFLVGIPLGAFLGYLLFLQVCKMASLWPVPSPSGASSILHWLNPINYFLSPKDFVKASKSIATEFVRIFSRAKKEIPELKKEVSQQAAKLQKDISKRYFEKRPPPPNRRCNIHDNSLLEDLQSKMLEKKNIKTKSSYSSSHQQPPGP